MDLCERAAKGERVQVERPYLKSSGEEKNVYGRGLLTLSPIEDEKGHVEELAVSLIDCDEVGIEPENPFAKSRLSEVNARIQSMLSLAQTVVEVSDPLAGGTSSRDRLSDRLDALGSVIDAVSDPDLGDMPVEDLVKTAMHGVPETLTETRLTLMFGGGNIPIASVPLMILMLTELVSNACRHGAWRGETGTVSIQSEVLDSIKGRVLRLHWIEDGGPRVSAVLGRGFGMVLGERLFPQITGGTAHLLNSEEGLSWTFELPVPQDDEFDFDGLDL